MPGIDADGNQGFAREIRDQGLLRAQPAGRPGDQGFPMGIRAKQRANTDQPNAFEFTKKQSDALNHVHIVIFQQLFVGSRLGLREL